MQHGTTEGYLHQFDLRLSALAVKSIRPNDVIVPRSGSLHTTARKNQRYEKDGRKTSPNSDVILYGECSHSGFFFHVVYLHNMLARRQTAYIQVQRMRTSHCLRACGVLHPVVNRGWGDPAHAEIPIPVSTVEKSTFFYIPFLCQEVTRQVRPIDLTPKTSRYGPGTGAAQGEGRARGRYPRRPPGLRYRSSRQPARRGRWSAGRGTGRPDPVTTASRPGSRTHR